MALGVIGTAGVNHGLVTVATAREGQESLLHDAMAPFLLSQFNPEMKEIIVRH